METQVSFLFGANINPEVRMEVFPERDGNDDSLTICDPSCHQSEWSSSLKGMETNQIEIVLGRDDLFCPNGALP